MSYNISSTQGEEFKDFKIPVNTLMGDEVPDNWKPEMQVIDPMKMEVEVSMGEITIEGVMKDGLIHVTNMDLSGEGSGSFMHHVLMDAFKKSTGLYKGVHTWEGGDTVSRFQVKDGVITEKDIDDNSIEITDELEVEISNVAHQIIKGVEGLDDDKRKVKFTEALITKLITEL